jgi:preprotein translocase subunit SecA
MLQSIGRILGGDPHKKEIKRLSEVADRTNALEREYEALSMDALRAKSDEFRKRLADGETFDDIMMEAFATVREASKRTIGLRHYDVQMIGGAAIHEGTIIEMRTGEGKTLVGTLPVYLNALTGKGVHLITVNDYLARRDARWMSPIYNLLGLSVGVLQSAHKTDNGKMAFMVDLERTSGIEDQHQLVIVTRKQAYAADITYGTNNEFGFDYLRDNLTMRLEDRVQRTHHFAIIDEVDNILIDEARTPLIISGPASSETEWYVRMAQVVRGLNPEDYEISEKDRNVVLTEAGEVHVEEILDTPLRDPDRPEDITPEQARLLGYLEQALRAQFLFKRDKEYLVTKGQVVIVDEFTGRTMPGRRWSEGLHQAVEAKEGVKVEPENITYATITLQNFFRMYEKLAGMTGTAITESEEFSKIYELEVLQMPSNLEYVASLPDTSMVTLEDRDEDGYKYTYYARKEDTDKKAIFWKRKDYPDVVYRTEEAKLRATVAEIIRFYIIGRPQLVGTTSVEHSERLSGRLAAESIRRFAQVLLIRHAWMEKFNIEFVERSIPELESLNTRLPDLQSGELRQLARQVDLTLNPESDENLDRLLVIFGVSEGGRERLKALMPGGIPHNVLNARRHDEESQIIASAGAFGAVTIATNMAGRGVDIKLGGEIPEEMSADVIHVLNRAGHPQPFTMTNRARQQALLELDPEQYGDEAESVKAFLHSMEEMVRVRAIGGLHVIGSERHEARRIDNQLRGRAARQGDPGSSRFYLSLEDELMRLFGGQQAEALFSRLNVDENMPIEHGMLGRLVEQSQERVEGQNFDIRKHLLEYDDVMNTQRQRIYAQRDRVFTKEDLQEDIHEMVRVEMEARVPQAYEDEEGPWKLLAYLEEMQPPIQFEDISQPSYSLSLVLDELRHNIDEDADADQIKAALLDLAGSALQAEKEHLMSTTRSLIERTADSYELQREERFEALDNFTDTLEDIDPDEMEPLGPKELQAMLNDAARVPLRLSNSQLRSLLDGEVELIDEIKDQVDGFLTGLLIRRLQGAIERRLDESLPVKAGQLQDQEWDEAANQLFDMMVDSFDHSAASLLGPQGSLSLDLDTALKRQEINPGDDDWLASLLHLMTQGTRITFDSKTHRRGRRQYLRLKYFFLAARMIGDFTAQQAVVDVLEHLDEAHAAHQQAIGALEWNRMNQVEARLQMLQPHLKERLIGDIGQERFDAIADLPLQDIDEDTRLEVRAMLGWFIQNELHRQLLLRVISDQWVEHLTRIEALRVTIGLEAYAQRDPLVMYKGAATSAFSSLLGDIRKAVISRMFGVRPRQAAEIEASRAPAVPAPAGDPQKNQQAEGSASKKKRRKRHKKN